MAVTVKPGMTVRLAYSPDQPRDEHGRFGEGNGATFLARGSRGLNHSTVEARTSTAVVAQAKANAFSRDFDAHDYQQFSEMAEALGHEDGEPPSTWVPGSPEAASEAVAAWQSTFDQSAAIQGAADELLGHSAGDVEYTGRDAALANELLNGLTDKLPDGTVNWYGIDNNNEFGVSEPANMTFDSADQLTRGMNDDDGSVSQMFRDAQANGRDVSFSLAGFVIGGPLGSARRADLYDVTGENPPSAYDPETGEEREMTSFDEALKFTTAREHSDTVLLGEERKPQAGVIVTLDGKTVGLNMDNGYEALTGGTFAIKSIRSDTAPNPMSTHEQMPITVVTLRQTALPTRPT